MPSVMQARAFEPYVAGRVSAADRRSALHLIHQLIGLTDVTERHHHEQLKIGLWKWTVAEGIAPNAKFNTRYFSEGVREQRPDDKINHEHVWTLKSHVDALTHGTWTLESLEAHLTEKGTCCIVTVAEHARLSASRAEGWGRYVEAGIRVYDRLVGDWLDLDAASPGVEPAVEIVGPGRDVPDVAAMVDEHARGEEVRRLLHRLLRTAAFATAAPAPSWKENGEVSKYFRLHDGLLEEPTRAVAYVHWSGKVDFALQASDLPSPLAEDPLVRPLQDAVYSTTVSVRDDRSLEVAEDLLLLALDKLRAT